MLIGKKIKLNSIKLEDQKVLFSWINDYELVRLSGVYKPVSEWSHKKWIEEASIPNKNIIFAIRSNLTTKPSELIGVIQLINIHPVYRHGELVIRIGHKNSRGQGNGKEAIKLLTDYAFKDLNLKRVYLHVFETNTAAIKTYLNVGFSHEGRLKQHAFINGDWIDVLVMGLIKN